MSTCLEEPCDPAAHGIHRKYRQEQHKHLQAQVSALGASIGTHNISAVETTAEAREGQVWFDAQALRKDRSLSQTSLRSRSTRRPARMRTSWMPWPGRGSGMQG